MVQGVEISNGHIIDCDPSTGEVIERVPVSSPEAVRSTIAAAKLAQPAWADEPLPARIALLRAALRRLAEGRQALAELVTREMGKVLSEALEEVDGACNKDRFLSLVEAANAPVKSSEGAAIILRDPHGVVAICSPWNFPVDEILLLALPALAAGNAVVVKPSEVAPLCGARVAAALQAVLPPGLVGLVQGDGAVGAALVASPMVDMVAMTGSSDTGSRIMAAAATDLKRLVLELGGKDPMVVFADADIDHAAKDAVRYSISNCGQVCCAVERIFVAETIKEAFEAKVVQEAATWLCGNGLEPSSKIGPLCSRMQRDMVHRHVESAMAAGARRLLGGQLPADGPGFFYPATVLADVPMDAPISVEETFGPIVALSTFDGSEAKAVELANNSIYGLSASVYTSDVTKGSRVAARIRAGQVGVNNWPIANAPIDCPWVGHKRSGFGFHSGLDGWRQFSLPKSVVYTEDSDVKASPLLAR